MSVATIIGWVLALILIAVSLWIRRRRRIRARFTTRAANPVRVAASIVIPDASERLIYVENDGSARELAEAEKRYVDTPFSPLGGARPCRPSRPTARSSRTLPSRSRAPRVALQSDISETTAAVRTSPGASTASLTKPTR
jgi:hypothetical protein